MPKIQKKPADFRKVGRQQQWPELPNNISRLPRKKNRSIPTTNIPALAQFCHKYPQGMPIIGTKGKHG